LGNIFIDIAYFAIAAISNYSLSQIKLILQIVIYIYWSYKT